MLQKNFLLIFSLGAALCFLESARSASPQNSPQSNDSSAAWRAPDPATIPPGPLGNSIRLGLHIFNETPKYAAPYVGNKMTCSHCHLAGGTAPLGIPLVGVPGLFPMYREREQGVVTFEERIQQCFQRSENGGLLPYNSPEMVGIIAYAQWLSKGQPTGRPFPGRGLPKLPELTGDVDQGSDIYGKQCAVCHGSDGAGKLPDFPPVWGPDAYNDGAGMNNIGRMAAFVQHNMPKLSPGTLSAQQAYDVAAYIHSKPHQHFVLQEHE
jgi:thiosulfate dehydrogenase